MKTTLRVVAFLLAGGLACAGQKTKTLDVYWIDSEGGGSTLIVTPNDESVLIDTGNPGGRDAARIVAAAKAAGLAKIDYVLLTHFHIDHFGGGAEVAQQLPFGTIFQREIPDADPDHRGRASFPQQIKPWRDIAAPRSPLAPGVTIPLHTVAGGPRLGLHCVAADQKRVEPTAAQMENKNPLTSQPREIRYSDNDNSAAFVLSFGDFKFFDGGDLTWNYEAALVTPYNVLGRVDVYQTDHHGLDVSNNPVFIQSLAPTVVVMNNGPRKGGLPATFAAIKTAHPQALYQMHRSFQPGMPADGNAPDAFIANQDNFVGRDAVKCAGNIIKLTVAPDGKSYTISVPSTGHTHTYRTKS